MFIAFSVLPLSSSTATRVTVMSLPVLCSEIQLFYSKAYITWPSLYWAKSSPVANQNDYSKWEKGCKSGLLFPLSSTRLYDKTFIPAWSKVFVWFIFFLSFLPILPQSTLKWYEAKTGTCLLLYSWTLVTSVMGTYFYGPFLLQLFHPNRKKLTSHGLQQTDVTSLLSTAALHGPCSGI